MNFWKDMLELIHNYPYLFLMLHFQGSNAFENIFICLRKIYRYFKVFLSTEKFLFYLL